MSDESKTKRQLLAELAELRRQVAELQAREAARRDAGQMVLPSDERFAMTERAANAGSWEWDIRTGHLSWSEHIEPMFGFSHGQFSGTYEAFLESVHPDDRQHVIDSINACIASGKDYAVEHRIVWPDGSVHWMAETGNVIRDEAGQAIRMVGVVQDVTERKRVEEALRESQALLQAAVENLPFDFWALDLDGRYVMGNSTSIQHWGNLRGKRVEELDLTADVLAVWQSNNNRALAGEVVRGEVAYTHGGERRFYYNIVAPIRDGDRIIGILGVNLDITERREAEEALRQSNRELSARNEELDAFAHTVAHDLRNPLSLIMGYAETLEKDYPNLQGQELHGYLHNVAQNVRKMVNIIDELLLLAGVRQIEPVFEPLDMGAIVGEAIHRLADMIEKHQAKVVTPNSWPKALGHGPWVEEVWVNYLSNAIQYGGRPPHIELGAEAQPDGKVRFWVRDHGPGISPDDQPRLFTPFTRLDQVSVKGYGLGLPIARRIVEKLGGQVGVESAGVPGQGSTFFFTLPRAL